MTEDDIQLAVAQTLDDLGLLWCHVPNGEKRTEAVGRKLKRLGVKRGVPDVLIFDPPPAYPVAVGAALELKTAKGRVSRHQVWWVDGLRERMWLAAVVRGPEEAAERLKEWGYV